MFEDSLIESGGRLRTKRGATTVLSFVLQVALIGVLVLLPLLFTEALPKTQLMTFLVAPPPPPPPPPPAAAPAKVVKQIQTDIINGQLRTPTKIPEKVQMIRKKKLRHKCRLVWWAACQPGFPAGRWQAPYAA